MPYQNVMANFFSKIFRRDANLTVNTFGDREALLRNSEPEYVSSADKALTLSTVYRCITLLSESVANLPLRIEHNEGGIWRVINHDLAWLLGVQPNEWTSAFDFWKQAVQNRLLHGDSFIVPQFHESEYISRFILMQPGTMTLTTTLGEYMASDIIQHISGPYSESDVVRLKGMSVDGIHTMSVIGYAARAASIAATADRNTLTTFANGGATMGIVSNMQGVPGYGQYQGDALEALADRMSQGVKRGDRIIYMNGDVKYTPFTMTAADMQFLESRKFTVREICRFFGVHPSFVFDDTSNNYKSAEMANVAFLSNTLNPILRQIENELTRKLLDPTGNMRFRFDREEIYATDLDSRMRYIEKRIQTGTMTPNEARVSLGKDPVEGGNNLLVSANLKPVTELTKNANK